jgi:hypothetical protein
MRTIFLAIILAFLSSYVLSPACKAQDSNNPANKTRAAVRQQKEIFPKISTGTSIALTAITYYANQRDLQPLKTNHLRVFLQPAGIVSEAVDVNLSTGDLILYPGTHDQGDARKTTISPKDLADLRGVLVSKEFLKVPQQNRKIGADGSSDIIEVDIDGSYTWKIHWVTDDPNLINTLYKINSIISAAWMTSYAQQAGMDSLKTNHVRLFADASLKNTYSITDIDLSSGQLFRNRQGGITKNSLNAAEINQLKQMLTSKEFHTLTPGSRRGLRANGIAYLIEYDIDGTYFKKIISALTRDDEYFNKVREQINSLVYK